MFLAWIWLGIETAMFVHLSRTGLFQACHGHSGSVLGFGGHKPFTEMYLRTIRLLGAAILQ